MTLINFSLKDQHVPLENFSLCPNSGCILTFGRIWEYSLALTALGI
jgi:hypothetical protein